MPRRSKVRHPAPRVRTLPNGLRVILLEDDRSPAAAFNWWVKVGSSDERPGETGLAHVLEHMLFKGTPTRGVGAIAQEIEGAGGEINAWTSFDATVYHAIVAARYFDSALDVLTDAVTRPTIDAKELALEKDVILEEIKRDEDQPSRRLSRAMFSRAYGKHPYGRPVIGTRESVASYSRPEVFGFWEKWYTPSNMVLAVAGAFDAGEAMAKIVRATKHLKARRPPKRPARAARPVITRFAADVVTDDVHDIELEAAFPIPGVFHRDAPALDALALALGQGDSSRLAWRVKRIARAVTGVSASAYTPPDSGLFFVSAVCEADRAEEAWRLSMREAFRVLAEPVTAEELARARISIEGDQIYERETAFGLAKKLGYFEAIGGGLAEEHRYLDAIRALTPADVDRAARTWLDPRRITAGMLAPKENAHTPSAERLGVIVADAYREATKRPVRSRVVKGRGGETRHDLPGGVSLVVREERALPLVSMRAVFLGGLRFEEDATAGYTHLLARLLAKGTESKTYAEIVRSVDSFAGGVSGFSGFNSFGARLDALSAHARPAMELFADVVAHPALDARELEEERTQTLEAIKSMQDHPSAWVMRLFSRSLFTKHPYRLSMIGEQDRIAQVTAADLRAFYGRIAVPQNLSIAVVGDVDTFEAVDTLSAALDGFGAGREFTLPEVPAEPLVDRPRLSFAAKDKEQSHVVLGFLGSSLTDKRRFALELIATALSGQGGRLFLELRDRQGLAYHVSAFSQEAIDPGWFCVYVATDPRKQERALDAIRAELLDIAKEGLRPEELERNRRQLVGGFEIDLQRISSRAASLSFADRYGLGFDSYREYPKKVLAVTRDEIVEAARHFLDLEKSVLAVVGPEAEGARVAGGQT